MKEEEIKDKVLKKLTVVPLGTFLILAVAGLLVYGIYLLIKANIQSLSNLCRTISN